MVTMASVSGIQCNSVLLFIPVDNRLAELRNAAGNRIAVIARVAGGLNQLVNNRARRGAVRVPHSHVHDVAACCPCLCLQLVNDREHIRRQLFDAIEIVTRRRHISLVYRGTGISLKVNSSGKTSPYLPGTLKR